jgi:hypothetical protein
MTAVSPGADAVGTEGSWELPGAEPGETVQIYGAFIGLSSSHRPVHLKHPGEFATRTERCSACRWFEPRIFRETLGRERFLIHHTGVSRVPGESDRIRVEYALTGTEVIEVMATRKTLPTGAQETFLTTPAARVLAQASAFDEELSEAYRDRMGKLA